MFWGVLGTLNFWVQGGAKNFGRPVEGTVSIARIWCFLPFSAMIVRALQERSYEKNRGNYLTYELSLQSYDTHVSTCKWLSLIRWLMYAYANEPCPLVICLYVIGQIEKIISVYVMGHMAFLIIFFQLGGLVEVLNECIL